MEGVVFHQNTVEALSAADRHVSPPAGVEGVVFHQNTLEALSAADRRVSPPAVFHQDTAGALSAADRPGRIEPRTCVSLSIRL